MHMCSHHSKIGRVKLRKLLQTEIILHIVELVHSLLTKNEGAPTCKYDDMALLLLSFSVQFKVASLYTDQNEHSETMFITTMNLVQSRRLILSFFQRTSPCDWTTIDPTN